MTSAASLCEMIALITDTSNDSSRPQRRDSQPVFNHSICPSCDRNLQMAVMEYVLKGKIRGDSRDCCRLHLQFPTVLAPTIAN